MKNFLLLFIFTVVTCQALFSQELEGKQITLRSSTSVSGKVFLMKTICYRDSVKIKVCIKDSVSQKKLNDDSIYKTLMISLREMMESNIKNDSLRIFLKRLDSVRNVYTIYKTDSVLIAYSQFPEYSKLLSNLFKSSIPKLENRERNKNRIILDGTVMVFEFSQNQLIQFSADAHSPRKESHPLLYDYVNSTLNMYRSIRKDTFLTIDTTSGY
jgi:hypothetical protein